MDTSVIDELWKLAGSGENCLIEAHLKHGMRAVGFIEAVDLDRDAVLIRPALMAVNNPSGNKVFFAPASGFTAVSCYSIVAVTIEDGPNTQVLLAEGYRPDRVARVMQDAIAHERPGVTATIPANAA